MARKDYCIIDDEKQTVTFVVEKLTKKEQENLKVLATIGYKLQRTTADKLYPTEQIYTKENVSKFLKTKDKEIQKTFKDKMEEIAVDKKTNQPKLYKNGNPRKKGYINALKWFKEEFKEEFIDFIK